MKVNNGSLELKIWSRCVGGTLNSSSQGRGKPWCAGFAVSCGVNAPTMDNLGPGRKTSANMELEEMWAVALGSESEQSPAPRCEMNGRTHLNPTLDIV